jgi:hypothetical protein
MLPCHNEADLKFEEGEEVKEKYQYKRDSNGRVHDFMLLEGKKQCACISVNLDLPLHLSRAAISGKAGKESQV